MTLLKVLVYPDVRLKVKAEPVVNFDQELREFVQKLYDTMYHEKGIGLAATQVGSNKRVFVMDLQEEDSCPVTFINPVIVERSGEILFKEGCLSFPGITANVKRASKVTIEYQTLEQENKILKLEELGAVCVQHELDHLDGITFYDHLSPLKRTMIDEKLR